MSIGIMGAQLLGAAGFAAFGSRRTPTAAPAQIENAQSPGTSLRDGAGRASGGAGKTNGAQNTPNAQNAQDPSGAQQTNPLTGEGKFRSEGRGKTDKGRFDRNECETCKNRTYQDGSNDPGVSFKAPTKISADSAASAVMGHEQEHVTREQAKASSEGREVISQSVVLHSSICPECGRSYVAGGETTTVTGERQKTDNRFNVGKSGDNAPKGSFLNMVA